MVALNVMVVDDSDISIKMLAEIIENIGHKVVGTAKNGHDALTMYKRLNPDIVTMDITMPVMDGIEAVKKIKENFNDAFIMMVTSHGQEEMVMSAIKYGAVGF